MQCFPKNIILVLFGECVLKKDKTKVFPPIGNIFERYGHLSIIFYKKGHFKFNFLYFDKKPAAFPTEEKWKKKMLKNILKKHFLTNFKGTCDDVISFAKLARKVMAPFCLTSFSCLFIYLFIYLINCKIVMRSIFELTWKPLLL